MSNGNNNSRDGSSSSGASSFVAGISLPPTDTCSNDDAAALLQVARPDGYDFCITPLPSLFPTNISKLRPRRDVTNLDSKW